MTTPSIPPKTRDRNTAIFGPLVPDRTCGACTACCVELVVQSDEYNKPAGTPCAHLCRSGCGIYETRFPICRDWYCLWRHIPDLPDDARPDRLGAIFTFFEPETPHHLFKRAYISAVLFDQERATDGPLFDEVLAMFSEGDLPVWVGDEAGLVLSYPQPEVARCAMGQPNGNATTRAEAVRWSTGVRDQT
jgi:hypothetical protein